MPGWVGLMLWGVGAVAVTELLDWAAAIKRTGTFPWRDPAEPPLFELLFTVVARLLAAAFVVALGAANGQITSAVAAAGVGIAAPVILEKVGRSAVTLVTPATDQGTAQGGG